ncbi:hypothetical protein [Treponema berlinense]|uniref:hypothetical protein n=1 Tax=Treponema berlinense TaxID=225004 RepID=UPI0026EB6A99|nr:hypothetical protein [Treponema berlinense]
MFCCDGGVPKGNRYQKLSYNNQHFGWFRKKWHKRHQLTPPVLEKHSGHYEKLVKITSKLWSEKGYNVCALWKMSKITNALSGFTLKPSPCRSSGEAVPKRTCLQIKLSERRNEGATTPQLRSGRFDGGCAPKKKRSTGFFSTSLFVLEN